MFFGKKKTVLEKIIDEKGIESAAAQIAPLVNEKIGSIRVAKQFVLEELDAARQGNLKAQRFVKESGYDEDEYKGALRNSFEEVDGANGPQQMLNMLLVPQLQHNMDLMVDLRTKIIDRVMEHWGLGKYQNGAAPQMDIFTFDNSDQIISAPKGESKLIALLNGLEIFFKSQMWHVQKIGYGTAHNDGVLFSVIGQTYLKFNGPDINIAKQVEASECTLGIIENDLDVLPTVFLQLSFNFYENDIEVNLHLFDSRNHGGYSAIRGLYSLVDFTRDEFLGSFAQVNPDSELERLLQREPLFDSELLYSKTFHNGPMELANHLEKIISEVTQIALRATINL